MKMWLDDLRDPNQHGHIGWVWVKTYEEAVALLASGVVEECSLDHDLSIAAMLGQPHNDKTGYDVVCWMIDHDVWPEKISVHSINYQGAERMRWALRHRRKA